MPLFFQHDARKLKKHQIQRLYSLKPTKKGRIRANGIGFVVDSSKAKPACSGLGGSAAYRSSEILLHSWIRSGRDGRPTEVLLSHGVAGESETLKIWLMEPQEDLQRFRPFLKALANEMLYSDLRKKVDPSDLVQQTMLQAIEAQSQFRGDSDAAKAGWLKAILGNLFKGLLRRYHSPGRDIAKEKELLAHSRTNVSIAIAESLESPSQHMQLDEEKERMLKVLESLTLDQRRAIVLRYWEDKNLEEIATQMEKTPEAIAGLIYRGMKVLRTELN